MSAVVAEPSEGVPPPMMVFGAMSVVGPEQVMFFTAAADGSPRPFAHRAAGSPRQISPLQGSPPTAASPARARAAGSALPNRSRGAADDTSAGAKRVLGARAPPKLSSASGLDEQQPAPTIVDEGLAASLTDALEGASLGYAREPRNGLRAHREERARNQKRIVRWADLEPEVAAAEASGSSVSNVKRSRSHEVHGERSAELSSAVEEGDRLATGEEEEAHHRLFAELAEKERTETQSFVAKALNASLTGSPVASDDEAEAAPSSR
ncbi:hypothetical protein T492DRAFT_1028435 [Pavlovales sp. CCMP2436]|nr:hypothetical protein T492DRAFT_1028435 [Pavlovales sp. CCMP2436]